MARKNKSSGNGQVGSSTKKCPSKDKPAMLVVDLYHADTGNPVKDASYEITGPTPKQGRTTVKPLVFDDLIPGKYTVSISVEKLPKYGSESSIRPASMQGATLAPDDLRTVRFNVYPPASALIVQVVDDVTGKPIARPGVVFKVVLPSLKREEATIVGTGSLLLPVEPGDHAGIKVNLSDPEMKDRYVMAEPGKATVKPGQTAEAKVKLKVRELRLISVDDHFAPGAENLEIKYAVRNMQDQKVWLRIQDAQDTTLYEKELTGPALVDNSAALIQWDGKANQKAGAFRAGEYLNPAAGPYKVTLLHPITRFHEAEDMHQLPTEVICDVLLEHLSWLDVYRQVARLPGDSGIDPPADPAKRNMWLKFKLNQIGFYAGPINGRAEDPDFQKALRRYRLMRAINGAVARQFTELGSVKEGTPNDFPAELTAISSDSNKISSVDALVTKLKLEETTDPACMPLRPFDRAGDLLNHDKEVKIYLDGTRYYIDNPRDEEEGHVDGEWITQYSWANRMPQKFAAEDAWFSHPLVPLRAVVRIKRKDDSWEPVKDGVSVKVRWFWWDLPQDTSSLPCEANSESPVGYTTADFSLTRNYIEKALGVQAIHVGSRFYRNNASADFGGLLTHDDTANASAVWRLVEDVMGDGQHLIPPADRIAGIGGNRGYARTTVQEGRSGVYFRPSRLAGERYQLGLELDLGVLADDRGSHCKKTAKLTLWRRLRLAAFIPWVDTSRLVDFLGDPIDLDSVWQKVRAEYAHAYIELDPLSAANKLRLDGPGLGFSQAELDEISRSKQRKDSIPVPVLNANTFAARFADAAGSTRRDPATGLKKMEDAVGAQLRFDPNKISSISLFIFPKPAPTVVEGVNRTLGACLTGDYIDYLEQCIVKSVAASPLGKPAAIAGLRSARKVCDACVTFASGALPASVVQIINRAGTYYSIALGKLANADDDPSTWATGDADTWTPNARFNSGNVMTSLFGAARLVPFSQPEPVPPAAETNFDAFAAYLSDHFYPAISAILQIAVTSLTQNGAVKWQKDLQAAWGKQDSKIGDNELSIVRQGEFWTAKALQAFTPKNGPSVMYSISKAQLQQEAEPAVRANFSQIFYALFYRLSRQLNLAVRHKLRDKIEGPWPDGLIVVFNYTHGPFDFGTVGATTTHLTFQPMGASMALEAGVNWSSQTCFFTPHALIAHEMAHSVFLKHWLGGDGPDFTSHDNKDYNCMMGYPHLEMPLFTTLDSRSLNPGQLQVVTKTKAAYTVQYDWTPARAGQGGKIIRWSDHALPRYFKPHFCGKCNLMLRGWNIWAGGVLPKSSSASGDYDITQGNDFRPDN